MITSYNVHRQEYCDVHGLIPNNRLCLNFLLLPGVFKANFVYYLYLI